MDCVRRGRAAAGASRRRAGVRQRAVRRERAVAGRFARAGSGARAVDRRHRARAGRRRARAHRRRDPGALRSRRGRRAHRHRGASIRSRPDAARAARRARLSDGRSRHGRLRGDDGRGRRPLLVDPQPGAERWRRDWRGRRAKRHAQPRHVPRHRSDRRHEPAARQLEASVGGGEPASWRWSGSSPASAASTDSGSTTMLALQAAVEAEVHLGFVGVPALSIGLLQASVSSTKAWRGPASGRSA